MKIDVPDEAKGNAEVTSLCKLGSATLKLSSETMTAKLEWKKVNVIEIQFIVTYHLARSYSFPGGVSLVDGGFGYSAKWNVSYTDNGIELDPDGDAKLFTKYTHEGVGLAVIMSDPKLNQSKGAQKPFVEVSAQITVGYDDDGVDLSVGPVGGKILGSKGLAVSQFIRRVNLDITNRPPDPVKVRPKIRRETKVVGSFAFGDHTLKKVKATGEMLDYSKLSAWYHGLPLATKEKIMNGEPPGGKKIVMTGFTDNVGDEHLNFDLGTKRAIEVAKALEKISGVAWSKFIATPSKGEQDVRQENKNLEKKTDKHRRVEVIIHIDE